MKKLFILTEKRIKLEPNILFLSSKKDKTVFLINKKKENYFGYDKNNHQISRLHELQLDVASFSEVNLGFIDEEIFYSGFDFKSSIIFFSNSLIDKGKISFVLEEKINFWEKSLPFHLKWSNLKIEEKNKNKFIEIIV